MPTNNRFLTTVTFTVATTVIALTGAAQTGNTEWGTYGSDKAFTRSSSLAQINRDNVKSLQLVWSRGNLPAGTTGGPMTYMAAGKQLILVSVGGRGYGAGWLAFGLPQ